MEKLLIIIVGQACAGKTTVEKKLLNVGVTPLTIITTRERREDDPDHYKYICDNEVEDEIGKDDTIFSFLSNEDTWYIYKAPKATVSIVSFISDKDVQPIITTLGGKGTKILTYRLTAPEEAIRQCYSDRGYGKKVISKRMEIDREISMPSIMSIDRDEIESKILKDIINFYMEREKS
jgi:guanylate kinase